MPQWNLPNAERAKGPVEESEKDFWYENNLSILQRQLLLDKLNKNMAKNVILFIGDGMSIPTLMVSLHFSLNIFIEFGVDFDSDYENLHLNHANSTLYFTWVFYKAPFDVSVDCLSLHCNFFSITKSCQMNCKIVVRSLNLYMQIYMCKYDRKLNV